MDAVLAEQLLIKLAEVQMSTKPLHMLGLTVCVQIVVELLRKVGLEYLVVLAFHHMLQLELL